MALALHGVHEIKRVVGIGGIGADNIPSNLVVPLQKNGQPKWIINLFYNLNDNIYDHNATIIDKLVYDGFATCDRFQGEHNARDYIINRSFSDLIHRAINLFQV